MNVDTCTLLAFSQLDDLGRSAIANAGSVDAEVQVISTGYAYDLSSNHIPTRIETPNFKMAGIIGECRSR